MHEADFNTTPTSAVIDSLVENGCVLIRNFADPARLQRLKAVLDGIYTEVKNVHVFGSDLKERGLPEIHEYIFAEKHRALLDQVFAGWQCELYNTLARRVEPPGLKWVGEPWQQPLPPYIEAFLHGLPFTVYFWVPLQPCGADAPRVGVVRAPFGDILDFSGYHDKGPLYLPEPERNFARFNGWSRRLYQGDREALQAFRARYADRIWAPHYRLGDAMMLTNWTFFFTHAQAGMTERRENVELRFRARGGNKLVSLADFLERRAGSSAASAFTFIEEELAIEEERAAIAEQPVAADSLGNGAAESPPVASPPGAPESVPPELAPPELAPAELASPKLPLPDLAPMEGERELSSGMLAASTSFRLLVKGRVGAKEIERLIRKLELDRDILADEGGR
jgi:hypothetical protein